MKPGHEQETPEEFRAALMTLRSAALRPEVSLSPAPSPARLAPYTTALSAELEDLASGRFVVLYDPAGVDAWHGKFRIVTLTRSSVEPDVAHDGLLAEVAWSWLEESLELSDCVPIALGGTVSQVASYSFGAFSEQLPQLDLEIRASWTASSHDLGPHLAAWTSFLCATGGVPRLPDGVTPLRGKPNTVIP